MLKCRELHSWGACHINEPRSPSSLRSPAGGDKSMIYFDGFTSRLENEGFILI